MRFWRMAGCAPMTLGRPGLLAVLILGLAVAPLEARRFAGEGSDLLMGVGAHSKAMAGAVLASTDDVYASYWNPAGLSRMQGMQFSVSKNLRGRLVPVDFIGIAASNSVLERWGLSNTLALAYFHRLDLASLGRFDAQDFESIFLRLTLPGLPEDFDGVINSKTKEYRLAWGVAAARDPRWRFGLALAYIDCQTFSCGVRAEDPGSYEVRSTRATTLASHLGLQFHLNESFTLALIAKDFDASLQIDSVVTDAQGSRRESRQASFPREISLGYAWTIVPGLLQTGGLQKIFGHYSDHEVDFLILRQGWSWRRGDYALQAGLLAPLRLHSENAGNLKPRWSVAPTLGLSHRLGAVELALAVFADPVMSKHRDRAYPTAEFSLSYRH